MDVKGYRALKTWHVKTAPSNFSPFSIPTQCTIAEIIPGEKYRSLGRSRGDRGESSKKARRHGTRIKWSERMNVCSLSVLTSALALVNRQRRSMKISLSTSQRLERRGASGGIENPYCLRTLPSYPSSLPLVCLLERVVRDRTDFDGCRGYAVT